MKSKPYYCKHFSTCERKNISDNMCKKCAHCKEDLTDVEFDASETIFYKEKRS